MECTLDIQKIIEMLPHRYPMVLIDRVIELIPGEKIAAIKNVTCNEPFFRGHFPQDPIMPGVLIVEGMAQAGGVLAFSSQPEEMYGRPVYFMGMDKVKFRKPVVPGDQLMFDVRFLKKSSWAVKLSGTAMVGENKVSEAEFTATFARETGKISSGG
jgi:beta-hydroxyacyl-ACP dehydratase FabZ